MRMQERYQEVRGDFFAAAITYFTVFAMFPLLMVAFAVAGFVLSRRPGTLAELQGRISSMVSGELGEQLINVMDAAIDSRTGLGVIGLATAAWAGLGWMGNIREALGAMWQQPQQPDGFVKRKLSDLAALLSTFAAMALTIGLTALGDEKTVARVLGWFGLHDVHVPALLLVPLTMVLALLISWSLFTWMIARLPRERLPFGSAARGGLIAAVGFEVFKQVASIYLKSVMHGPAGATFGPVIGIMVFAYVTARLLLYATAWAATTEEGLLRTPVPVPETVVISRPADASTAGVVAAMAIGALGALGISWLSRDRS